ncbi:ATP-binding protein [bacterium]|nr:ATP-binding protein [bacterium]
MTNNKALFTKSFSIEGSNFQNAGAVSKQIKKILKQLNIDPEIIWRFMIVCYEAEMNVVLYAEHCDVVLNIFEGKIHLTLKDKGPGIPNIEKALTEGYSTATRAMRERGFGAGLGLPNIKKTSDEFEIESTVGMGTTLNIGIFLPK